MGQHIEHGTIVVVQAQGRVDLRALLIPDTRVRKFHHKNNQFSAGRRRYADPDADADADADHPTPRAATQRKQKVQATSQIRFFGFIGLTNNETSNVTQ